MTQRAPTGSTPLEQVPFQLPGMFPSGVVLLIALFIASPQAWAVDTSTTAPMPMPERTSTFQLQESDDEVTRLEPKAPRSPETQKQLEAVSWFLTGRLAATRNDSKTALEAFRKAAELDPNRVDVLKELVPLLFKLGLTDEAILQGRKAADLQPDDFTLHREIGEQLATRGQLTEGLQYLTSAALSPKLDPKSADYVLIHRQLGIVYELTGQIDKAADAYEVVFAALTKPGEYSLNLTARTALLGDSKSGFAALGRVFLAAKRTGPALEALELAAKANLISIGELTYSRAKILLLKGEGEPALAELQKYFDAQRQTKGAEAYELLSEILTKLGRSDELIPRLEKLVEKDNRNSQLRLFLANRLVDAGNLARAEELFKQASTGSRDPEALLGLARVYRSRERIDDLIDTLGKLMSKGGRERLEAVEEQLKTEFDALCSDPRLIEAVLLAGRKQAQATPPALTFEEGFVIAKLANQAKQIDAAEEFFRLALERAKERGGEIYPELAEALADAGRYAQAAKVYQEALQIPDLQRQRLQLTYLMAHSLEMSGQTDEALASLAEVKLQLGGDFPLPFALQEAWIYMHSHQYDKAIEAYQKLMTQIPAGTDEYRRCQYGLSNVYVQKGEMRKGEEILESVLVEKPEDPSVNNDLGYLYADQGKNLEQAEQMIRKAVAAEPDNAAYQDSLGWVLFKLERFDEARIPLERSIELADGPPDATLWDHLGDCYHRLKLADKAIESWKKALLAAEGEFRPDEKLVQRIKEKLSIHDAASPAEGEPTNPPDEAPAAGEGTNSESPQ